MIEIVGRALFNESSVLIWSINGLSAYYYEPLWFPVELAAVIFCCFCFYWSCLLSYKTLSNFYCLNLNSVLISLWVQIGPLTHGWEAIAWIYGLSVGIKATIFVNKSWKLALKYPTGLFLEWAFQKVSNFFSLINL